MKDARVVASKHCGGYVPDVLGRVLAIIGLLALNGFFVAAEFSVVRSRRSRLEAMARAGDAKARIVLRATAKLARLLSASQFGITLASIGIGALAEETLSHAFASAFERMPLPARDRHGRPRHHLRAGGRDLRPRGVRRARAAQRGAQPSRGGVAVARAAADAVRLAHDAVHLVLNRVGGAGAPKLFGQKPVNAEENVHSRGRAAHPRGAEPGGGRARAAGRGADRGRVRVLGEERARGDDAAHGDRRAAARRDARRSAWR